MDSVIRFKKQERALPADRPPVRVARLDGTYYLLADHHSFYIQTGGDASAEIDCTIIPCKDEVEYIIQHVRINRSPATLNPLKLSALAGRLSELGVESGSIPGILGVRGLAEEPYLELRLRKDVYEALDSLCSLLAGKLSSFTLPYYIPYMISRCEPVMQADLAARITKVIEARPMTDARFNWPSPEEIELIANTPMYTPTDPPVVASPPSDEPAEEEVKRASELIKRNRDVMAIPATEDHPAYLVDTKKKRVSTVAEGDSVTVLHDVDAKRTFLFPQAAVDALKLQIDAEITDVKMVPFRSAAEAMEFLRGRGEICGAIFYR